MIGFVLSSFLISQMLVILWAAIIVLAAPIAAFFARKPLSAPHKPRVVIYAGSAANLLLVAAITGVIDVYRGSRTIHALNWPLSLPRLVVWSLGLTLVLIIITVATFSLRQRLNRPLSPIVMSLLPQTRNERTMFFLLCLLVALVEEFLFRGFAFSVLSGVAASPLIAGLIVTISFALQHGVQDIVGIFRAFVLGVLLLIPVLITGSLLPSIVAHGVVDVFSGLYSRAALASLQPR
jgi:membrane protease YdiL (CAAX protease family)